MDRWAIWPYSCRTNENETYQDAGAGAIIGFEFRLLAN
jgi:hypothetical protein